MAHVLVIDDNAVNLDLMLYLLQAFGHVAEGHTDALAALEAAKAGDFDIVLTDILMPRLDGYEFTRRLRSEARRYGSIPFVAVTALAMPGDRERISSAGFDGYIGKPIEPQAFVAQVESYLRRNGS
ncbi:MAG TPA: response regulator [Candidatus Acidoferrum sp.]|nr:response regulator [Candidatus Acidoferrum sp.]